MSIIDRIIKASGIRKAETPPSFRGQLTAAGHALKMGDNYIIFTNPDYGHMGSEFTVAHELGHILLGHLDDPNIAGGTREAELEASVFASVLLAFSLINKMEGIA